MALSWSRFCHTVYGPEMAIGHFFFCLDCAIIIITYLLAWLAWAIMWSIGPWLFLYRPHPSTLPQPQATFSSKALTLSKRLIFWETLLLVLEMKTYHFENTRKNFCSSVAATAFGYNWHVRATNMAHDTPPRKPNTLE